MVRRPKDAAGVPGETGNTSSADNLGRTRPWTKEEMDAAKPLPLPTVDADAAPDVHTSGVPHAGKGETKPAGRPEDEAETLAE